MSVTEGATVEVCASVNAVYPTHERDIVLMFTLTPESEFASESEYPGKLDCYRMGILGQYILRLACMYDPKLLITPLYHS